MHIFETALGQMIILFALMAIGFYARKKDIMNDAFDAKLSNLVLNVTMPVMIVAAVLTSKSLPDTDTILQIIGWGAVAYLFASALALVFGRLLHTTAKKRGTFEYLLVFSNISIIGFPVLSALFGSQAVVYGAIFNIPSTLATWTIGVVMLSKNGSADNQMSTVARVKQLAKSLVSPCMIACIVSVFLVAGNVTDHGVLANTLNAIGQFTLPGAMFVLGSSIAKAPIRETFTDVRCVVVSLVKLTIVPLCVYGLMSLFVQDHLLVATFTMLFAMPAASSGTMMCIDYDGDLKEMASGTFLTTVFSMGTIPAMAMMLV